MVTISRRSRPCETAAPVLPRVRCRFLFHGPLPGWAGSYIASAGVSALGPTGREFEQVTGRVDVTVLGESAVLAGEYPFLEGQLGSPSPPTLDGGVSDGHMTRPSSMIGTPSMARVPPPPAVWRRSLTMSQCSEDMFTPPHSG